HRILVFPVAGHRRDLPPVLLEERDLRHELRELGGIEHGRLRPSEQDLLDLFADRGRVLRARRRPLGREWIEQAREPTATDAVCRHRAADYSGSIGAWEIQTRAQGLARSAGGGPDIGIETLLPSRSIPFDS